MDQVKEMIVAFEKKAADIEKALASTGAQTIEFKQTVEKMAKEHAELGERLREVEQKAADKAASGDKGSLSIGASFVKSAEFQRFKSGEAQKARHEVKSTTLGSDATVAPERLAGVVGGAFRTLRLRDVLLSGTTASNSIEITRELEYTNAAAETAEGEAKPESDVDFELVTVPVRTVAHWLKVSRQFLDDAPAVASFIDQRLRYGVEKRIDEQLLAGNGTAPNIGGLTRLGNHVAFTPEAGESAIDSVNRAIYSVWAADYAPTAVIMNPADWGAIEREIGTDGQYLLGDPKAGSLAQIWGLPVVLTNSMAAGKVMVGAFDIAAQVFNRQGVAVEASESDGDNFTKNLVTLRAEARLALAVYRPASIVYGDLTLVAP